jgi:hypothetical protein
MLNIAVSESSCLPKFDLPASKFSRSEYFNLKGSKNFFLSHGVGAYLLKLIACSHDNTMNDASLSKGMKIASIVALTVASIFIAAPIGLVDALARSVLALLSLPLLLSDKTSGYPEAIGLSTFNAWFYSIPGAIWFAPISLLIEEHSFAHEIN